VDGEEEEEEEWSLFGELMAHDASASLPPSSSPLSTSRSPSSSRVRRSSDRGGEGVVVPNLHVRRTQSPTSDIHFEDYFPLEEEEEEEGEEESHREGVSSLDAGVRPSRMRVDSDAEPLSSTSSRRGSGSRKDRSLSRGKDKGRSWRRLVVRLPTLPTLYRNILKCSLAYLLGSLFTYYTPLAHFISEWTQDSPGEKYPSVMGHMVATV
jgi:hypothetical protein